MTGRSSGPTRSTMASAMAVLSPLAIGPIQRIDQLRPRRHIPIGERLVRLFVHDRARRGRFLHFGIVQVAVDVAFTLAPAAVTPVAVAPVARKVLALLNIARRVIARRAIPRRVIAPGVAIGGRHVPAAWTLFVP